MSRGNLYVKLDFNELNKFGKRVGKRASVQPYFKDITDELGESFTKELIKATPRGKKGELQFGWKNVKPRVYTKKDGYSISIRNTCDYAYYVNYGHQSFNQYNVGDKPYVVRNRIKVPIADKRQKGDGIHWVFGHFFVEKAMERAMANKFATSNRKVKRQLQKWVAYCVNGGKGK